MGKPSGWKGTLGKNPTETGALVTQEVESNVTAWREADGQFIGG
jgi:hypothetical protein